MQVPLVSPISLKLATSLFLPELLFFKACLHIIASTYHLAEVINTPITMLLPAGDSCINHLLYVQQVHCSVLLCEGGRWGGKNVS